MGFKEKIKPKNSKKKNLNKDILESVCAFFDDTQKVLNGFKSGIFPVVPIEGT